MNRTYGKGSQWERLKKNKLLMLCAQKVIKARRATEKARITAIEKRYEERKLAAMMKNRSAGLKRSRMEFARQWVLLDFAESLPTASFYKKVMGMVRDTKKQTASEYDDAGGYNQTEKDEWTKEIYETIVYGCKYAEGETNTSSCSDKTKKCKLGCSCPMSQWRKHMEQHVTKLLTLYAAGTIKKPAGPTVPQFFEQLRGGGGLSLGGHSTTAEEVRDHRHQIFDAFITAAMDSPEEYSPVVRMPSIDGSLVGRKIEVRCKMQPEDEALPPFMHCFEGTITAFAPRTPTAKKKLECDCRSKWAVVKIKIDDDCLHDDADNDDEWLTIPLNDRIYNSEGVDKGWTILAEEFVEYEQTQAAAAAAAAVRTVATEQEVVAAFYGGD